MYKDSKRIYYLRIEILKEIDETSSNSSLVTDYIVINLVKKEQVFWEKMGIEEKTRNSFNKILFFTINYKNTNTIFIYF